MQRKYSEVVNYVPNFPKFQYRPNSREPLNSQKLSPVEQIRPNNNPAVYNNAHYPPFQSTKNISNELTTAHTSTIQSDQRRSLPNYNLRPDLNRTITQTTSGFRNNGLVDPATIPRRTFQHNMSAESPQIINSPQNFTKQRRLQLNKMPEQIIKNMQTTHTSPIKLQTFPRSNTPGQNLNMNAMKYQNQNSVHSPTLQQARQTGRIFQSMIISESNVDAKYQISNKNIKGGAYGTLGTAVNPSLNDNNGNNNLSNYANKSNGSGSGSNTRNNSANDLQSLLSSQGYTAHSTNQIPNRPSSINSPKNENQVTEMKSKKMQYNANINVIPSNYANAKARKNQQVWKSAQFPINKNQSLSNLNRLTGIKFYDPVREKDQDFMRQIKKSIQNLKVEERQRDRERRFPKTQVFSEPYSAPVTPVDLKFRKKTDLGVISQVDNLTHSSGNIPVKHKQPTPRNFTIDDFEIIEKLGRGTYGDVFLVRERKSRFVCVLKTLSKKRIKQLGIEQHVFRQIKIQSYLFHKHLTNLYGFFDDPSKIYLIMQCMPDGSMSSNGKKKISESEAAHLIAQVCDGLLYMHRQDIIHRDIKPQNLLLNNTYLKIADFGCAVFGNTLRRTVVGSYAYISPEQFSNSPYDEKIDSWCVGILAYQMLTGKPPYEQRLRKMALLGNQNSNIHQENGSKTKQPRIDITQTMQFPEVQFPQNVKLSNQAMDFIKRLLDKDPAARADIKQALKHKFLLKAKQYQKYLQSQLQSKL